MAYVQLFKTDDPTHDPSTLDATDRWKSYVTSYENVEPTEGIRFDQPLTMPYLKRGVRQQYGEDRPSLESVVDGVKSDESLEFRVMHKSSSKYVLHFEPDTFEFASVKDPKVSSTEVADEAVRRGDGAEGIYYLSNEWMKGMSQEEVDETKRVYEEKYASA